MHYHLPPEAQSIIDTAVNSAMRGAEARRGHAAPQAVETVPVGQSFVRDCDPDRLLVRAYASDDIREHSALNCRFRHVCVVVIAATHFDNGRRVGEVFYLPVNETVRLVDIVRPLRAEAR